MWTESRRNLVSWRINRGTMVRKNTSFSMIQLDRWTELQMSRWIIGGLNGQNYVISVYCGVGLWFSMFTTPPLSSSPLSPVSRSVGQKPLVLWSVQMVSRSESQCPLVRNLWFVSSERLGRLDGTGGQ